MIANFLESWPLFHNAYLSGWLIAVLLSLSGVIVVARDQIFIGAAVAQASTLGIALGMWTSTWFAMDAFDPLHSHEPLSVMAIAFAIGAALLTARRSAGGGSHEAVTGWVFVTSASLSILVLAHSPFGLEEIHHLLSSSIIGATRRDVWTFAVLVVAAAALITAGRDRLVLFVTDPAMAAAVGMRTRLWSVLLAVWLGLAVGMSMRVTGLLFTFGSLILPPLTAAQLCRETRSMFLASAMIGLATTVVGFVLAHGHDHPPAQMAAAVQSATLAAAWCARRLGGRA